MGNWKLIACVHIAIDIAPGRYYRQWTQALHTLLLIHLGAIIGDRIRDCGTCIDMSLRPAVPFHV